MTWNAFEKAAKSPETHHGFISTLQQMIGISPTEGKELIQDLKPIHVKCHSAKLGAPRSYTGIARNHAHRATSVLASKPADIKEEDWSVEEVRSLTRAALTEIITKWR